jgi:hypothetical protein
MPTNRLAFLALLLLGQAQAATPRDSLFRYVPEDVGFCVVCTDLPGTVARLRESPFAAAFARALSKDAKGVKEVEEARKAAELVQKVLGLDWAELPDVIPGEAFVFVYRPGPPGKPELEQGLFLLRSKNGKALAALIGRLNAFQGVTLEDAEHKGVRYVRRIEKKGRTFYLLSGPVLLFTGQEEALKRAIEREKSLAKGAVPLVAKWLADLGLSDAPVAVVVNPRAFDAQMAAGKDKTALSLAKYWKALDAIGFGLHLKKDVTLSLAILGRTKDLPAAGRKLFQPGGKASALWGAFPNEPLLAVAGRADLPVLYAAVCEFMPDDKRKELEAELKKWAWSVTGKDVVKDLLPALGPDWGLCLLAPPRGSKEAAPRALAAIAVDGNEKAFLKVVRSWATLAVLTHNAKAKPDDLAQMVSVGEGKSLLEYIDFGKGAPPGAQPAWALRAKYLVLASNPDVVKAFKVGKAEAGEGTLLARVSFAAWRKFLKDQRAPVISALVAREGTTKKQAAAKLDAMDDWLALLNSLELRRYETTNRVTFKLRLKLVEPLMKAR